jgi:hypothetical protein
MGVDVGEPGLDLGDAVRVGGVVGLAQQRGALQVGASTVSIRLCSPDGASWATVPMRAPRGTRMEPDSSSISPSSSLSSVVLPTPLRPTRPTLWPVGIAAVAPSSSSLPSMR